MRNNLFFPELDDKNPASKFHSIYVFAYEKTGARKKMTTSTHKRNRIFTGGQTELQSPPEVLIRILELEKDHDVKIDSIVDAIQADPAISTKILKFCNSPVSGLSHEVTDIRQAIATLGMRSVKLMALSLAALGTNKNHSQYKVFQQFWHQSVAVAVAMRKFSQIANINLAEDTAFVIGLLSQISAMGINVQEEMPTTSLTEINEYVDSNTGANIREHTADLLARWNIPELIVDAIRPSEEDVSQLLDCACSIGDALLNQNSVDAAYRPLQIYYIFEEDESFDNMPVYEDFFQQVVNEWYDYLMVMGLDSPGVEDIESLQKEINVCVARLISDIRRRKGGSKPSSN